MATIFLQIETSSRRSGLMRTIEIRKIIKILNVTKCL